MPAPGTTEAILSASPGRVVVRVDRGRQSPIVVRRIEVDEHATPREELARRLVGLKLIEGRPWQVLAPVQHARLRASTLEITEPWIDGFPLSSVQAQAAITVDVALGLIHDLAQGLAELHRTVENNGALARLIHGRVTPEQVMIDVTGQVRLVGFEGLRGTAAVDAQALRTILLRLLDVTVGPGAVAPMIRRLRTTSFGSADAVQAALEGHLAQQGPERIWTQRYEFNRVVRRTLRLTSAAAPVPSTSEPVAPRRVSVPAEAPLLTPFVPMADAQTVADPQTTEAVGAWDSNLYPLVPSSDTIQEDRSIQENRAVDAMVERVALEIAQSLDDEDLDQTQKGSPPPEPVTAGPAAATDDWETPWSDRGPTNPTGLDPIDPLISSSDDLSESVRAPEGPSAPDAESAAPLNTDRAPPARSPSAPFASSPSATFGGSASQVAGRRAAATARRPSPVEQIDRYRVVAPIGRGGMGDIYLARKWGSAGPGPLVALKVLSDETNDLDFEDAVAMLMDEAAIMASIEHPHVLKVVDFGKALGRYFLATEYLEGRPLVRLMVEAYAREGILDYGVIATIGADAALGLHAAHTASSVSGAPLKVIHRDVSPQNIFVTYDGVTKVIDFGVARAAERVSRTEVGMVKGKTAYMSPEQAEGRDLDGRSDVFGLGVCLWEMIAGRRLFKRDREYETLLAVQTADVPPPTQLGGPTNPVLDHIVLSALQRNRSQRTPSAHALATQLMDFAEHASGPDRRRRVRQLLHRMFGDVAAKEHALIQRLEANAATQHDARELRALSGVAGQADVQQMTLMARPASLNELDDFGARSTRQKRTGPTTSEHVIQAVASASAALGLFSRRSSAIERRTIPAAPRPAEGSASSIGGPDAHAAGGPRAEAVTSDALSGHIESLESDGYVLIGPQPTPMAAGETPAAPTAPPDKSPRTRPAFVWLAVIVFVLGGAWWMIDQWGLKSPWSPEYSVAGRVGVVSDALADRHAARDGTAAVKRSDTTKRTRVERRSPIKAPLGRPDLDVLVRTVHRHGLWMEESRTTLVIGDAQNGTATVDAGAKLMEVAAPGAAGWVITSDTDTLAAAAWVGRIRGAPWFVRNLSVNTCRASVRVTAAGINLRYGRNEVRLPHGGGILFDVALEPPKFASRLELEPMGLSFGRPRSDRPQRHCRTGWWGARVVLRRLPPGQYTLRWVSDAVTESASMVLAESGVEGATLIQAVRPPSTP